MLSDDIKAFVHGAIKSVWALEVLLLMRARRDGPAWTIAALTRELRASEMVVREIMAAFHKTGLVAEADGAFKFAPSSPELEDVVAKLAGEYAKRPLQVINEIYADKQGLQ